MIHRPAARKAQESRFSNETAAPKPRRATAQKRSLKKRQDKFNRFAWRDAVFADTSLSAAPKCLAFGIAQHVNRETGEATVGTRKLADDCGFSQAWVRKTVPLLAARGWVQVQYGSRGGGIEHANHYKINQKEEHPVCSSAKPVEEHFSPLEEHPVCSEPLNHRGAPNGAPSTCYVDRGRRPASEEAPVSLETARALAGALSDHLPLHWTPDLASIKELTLILGASLTEKDLDAKAQTYAAHVSQTGETIVPLARWLHQERKSAAASPQHQADAGR